MGHSLVDITNLETVTTRCVRCASLNKNPFWQQFALLYLETEQQPNTMYRESIEDANKAEATHKTHSIIRYTRGRRGQHESAITIDEECLIGLGCRLCGCLYIL